MLRWISWACGASVAVLGSNAWAQDTQDAPEPVTAPPPVATATAPAPVPVTPETTPPRLTFRADPVLDGGIIVGTLGFTLILGAIDGTGEIRPQQISKTFDRSQLLGIDRASLSQTPSSSGSTMASIGLYAAFAYAVADPILSGVREDSLSTAIVDATMYGEAISMTLAVTALTKVAIRRPRPIAYIDAEAHKDDPNYSNSDTDSTLSFFSNHSSIVASIGGTATYLAFARSPHSVRPWITLITAMGLSAMVSYGRVRSGDHFPTDVIAGSIVGAGIGVLVPHLHRNMESKSVWVGAAPAERGEGGSLTLGGAF